MALLGKRSAMAPLASEVVVVLMVSVRALTIVMARLPVKVAMAVVVLMVHRAKVVASVAAVSKAPVRAAASVTAPPAKVVALEEAFETALRVTAEALVEASVMALHAMAEASAMALRVMAVAVSLSLRSCPQPSVVSFPEAPYTRRALRSPL